MPTMRVRHLILCLPLLCLTGCTWLPFAVDNLNYSASSVLHEYRFKQQSKRLADMAWQEACQGQNHPKRFHKSEYEKGFKAGFVDFLDCNGNGEPPGTLPRHLRQPILRNAEQQQEIFDWMEGFRHGARVASQEQWRSRIVVPVAVPPYGREEKFGEEIIPRTGPMVRGGDPATATFEPMLTPPPSPAPVPAPPPVPVPEMETNGVAVFE